MVTPTDEPDRIAERIYNEYGSSVRDKESFDEAFQSLIDSIPNDEQEKIRDDAYKIFKFDYPEKTGGDALFKKAGGKDLKMDRKANASVIVTDEPSYIRKGASHVDLKGFDTKKTFLKRPKAAGIVKGKVVKVYSDVITRHKKSIVVHRDRKGRFASRKRRNAQFVVAKSL